MKRLLLLLITMMNLCSCSWDKKFTNVYYRLLTDTLKCDVWCYETSYEKPHGDYTINYSQIYYLPKSEDIPTNTHNEFYVSGNRRTLIIYDTKH